VLPQATLKDIQHPRGILVGMPGSIQDPIGGQSRATIAAKQSKPQLALH